MIYLYGLHWHDELLQPTSEMTEAQAKKEWEQEKRNFMSVFAGDNLQHQAPTPDQAPVHRISPENIPGSGYVPRYMLRKAKSWQVEDPFAVMRYTPGGARCLIMNFKYDGDRLFCMGWSENWRANPFAPARSGIAFTDLYQANFELDGRMTLWLGQGTAQTRQEFTRVDLTGHWTDPPTWGHFDGLGFFNPRILPTYKPLHDPQWLWALDR